MENSQEGNMHSQTSMDNQNPYYSPTNTVYIPESKKNDVGKFTLMMIGLGVLFILGCVAIVLFLAGLIESDEGTTAKAINEVGTVSNRDINMIYEWSS